ncbi:LytTR family DNA-binding domain-containing protein [Brevundimonas sp.]|uniref:LytTR family DNA-binding domain-containing protein n=1 Tax=Brevundimonas sp. TaxID=1871086 RepID=UPI003F702073
MASENETMVGAPGVGGQSPGAVRTAGGDVAGGAGTDGDARGTSGVWARLRRANPHDLRQAYLIIAPVTALVVAVNSLTNLADAPDLQSWEPWCWEITSAAGMLAALWIPWLATATAPPEEALGAGWRPKARCAVVHLIALVALSALHVGVFVWLRGLVYDAMGGSYEFGDRFIYELRKDAISYLSFLAVFWAVGYLRRRRDEPVRPVSFDIRDGVRIIRAPLADIVAVSSAGNYVEFWLADGRRPLMRATLAAIEVELERFDFVRVHRSWLVNAGRVTGLRPDGSGDWTVELGQIEAPVSRRYPQALERLKSPV